MAWAGAFAGAGALVRAFALAWDFRSTEGRHHDGVIPVPPLALTTARRITGHMADARVIEVGSHDSACAGLAMPTGFRRCGRRHTLTFHCSNGLLKPLEPPALLGGTGVLPGLRQSPSTRSLSAPPGGYIADERCHFRRHAYHIADHDNRGRPDPFPCQHVFHLFQC